MVSFIAGMLLSLALKIEDETKQNLKPVCELVEGEKFGFLKECNDKMCVVYTSTCYIKE
jgi:hypothetical protein